MSSHPELGPELRQLAQAILERLDPALRAAAGMADETMRGPGRCEQVWCPVCALAALISGEQHPLLSLIAEHSVALMTMIRAMAADPADRAGSAGGSSVPASDDETATPPDETATPPAGTTRPASDGGYQNIPIVVESVPVQE